MVSTHKAEKIVVAPIVIIQGNQALGKFLRATERHLEKTNNENNFYA